VGALVGALVLIWAWKAWTRACPTKVDSGFVERQATSKTLEAVRRFYERRTDSR
jgi:hypothetical protein